MTESRSGELEAGNEHYAESLTALVRRAAIGEHHAIEVLVGRLYPVVRDELGRKLRGDTRSELDDLTQDAITRVATHIAQCRAESDEAVRAWVRIVAWRVALGVLRSDAAAVARRSQPIADHHVTEADPPGTPFGDAETDERRELSATERLARAAVEELNRLPGPTGLLFWMRLVDDATWAEIAGALGTTTAAVKRRFQRAQATLRRRLQAPPRDD